MRARAREARGIPNRDFREFKANCRRSEGRASLRAGKRERESFALYNAINVAAGACAKSEDRVRGESYNAPPLPVGRLCTGARVYRRRVGKLISSMMPRDGREGRAFIAWRARIRSRTVAVCVCVCVYV